VEIGKERNTGRQQGGNWVEPREEEGEKMQPSTIALLYHLLIYLTTY